MQTVSVINYKGSVGKTSVTANIAAELAWRGYNILLVDLDPQASLTFSFLSVDLWAQRYAKNRTIRSWYDAYIDQDLSLALPSLIVSPPNITSRLQRAGRKGIVDLICSHLSLINIDLELAARLSSGTLRQARTNFLRLHSRLLEGLKSEAILNKYEYVLIDCPPNFNIVTKTAIVASDRILIPTIPDRLSTLGIEELQRHVSELVEDFNGFVGQQGQMYNQQINPSIMGVVPTMVQMYAGGPIRRQAQFINSIAASGLPLFSTYVRRNNTKYGDAPQYGVPVVLQSASGDTYIAVREELEDLTTEFLEKI